MEEIRDYIKNLSIIDSHEHLLYPNIRKREKTGFFGLLHYFESDMVSSGLDVLLSDNAMSKSEKYDIFLRYFENTSNTTYAKLIPLFAKELYGIDKIDRTTLPELDRMVEECSQHDGWYKEVLVERANIEQAIVVDDGSFDSPDFLKPMVYLDFLMRADHIKLVNRKRAEQGKKEYGFSDYVEYVDDYCQKCIDHGIVAAKFGIPYWRDLNLHDYIFEEAKGEFDICSDRMFNFENYIFNRIINIMERHDIPVQIHTGHVEPSACVGPYSVTNGRVSDLIPVLFAHKDAAFVLLHGGFPYQEEYLSMVKNIPNAIADFSWIYIISPSKAARMLSDAIEMIPRNKIIGFGGDFMHVENTFAHAIVARETVSRVLEEKIKDGYFDIGEAKRFADMIFRENPKRIYNI